MRAGGGQENVYSTLIVCAVCIQVTVDADMSAINVTWAARGDSVDEQIAALLPTFASQIRSVNAFLNEMLTCN